MTLYELLHLSKETREALRDALVNSEIFLTQVPATPMDDDRIPCPQWHLMQQQMPSITFTPEDMLLKVNKHDRPLYYTRYIGSTCIEKIQVDPRSALSIIPKRLLYFLGIPLSRLSTTTTTIYSFNAGSSHPLGKIRLWYQIGDLKSEVICYVIDADTSYNLLLRRPWIHVTGSSLPHYTSASSMWEKMWWSERYSLKCNRSKEWKTISPTLFSTKRISNHWSSHYVMISTVTMRWT